jgi:hypothetical protein
VRIVVNHVTRMTGSRICVAGIEAATHRHVRPVTSPGGGLLTRELLREAGGPFGAGALVDIGRVKAVPNAPEMEDHEFDPTRAKRVSNVDGDAYLELLGAIGEADLQAAFGSGLERVGRTYAVEPGHGNSSLAVLRAKQRPAFKINEYGELRLWYNDVEPPAYLSVKDVRLFEDDQKTIKTGAVDDISRRLRRGVEAFLMLGLTRPWLKPGETHERHWLQLNGLCLADRPVGDLP